MKKITWMTKAVKAGRTLPAAAILVLLSAILSGCLYPDNQAQNNRVSYVESVRNLQAAVDDYYQQEGVLPIITAGPEIPRYEKFRINLEQLKNTGYIDDIPATAFEKGGSAYFLIINEETEPTVKVMDLGTVQKVNDVQMSVNRYMTQLGELPAGEELYPGYWTVDVSKIDARSTELRSVYSGQDMSYIMDEAGTVYADYAFDIMQALQKDDITPAEDEDLRIYLEKASFYVPVKSVPYRWINGAPQAQPAE
ncbi:MULTISPECIES: DUF3939 domain-containing protein [Paenibacillus]|nr:MULTISPECIES: DUF3939 domain-containing protein [Paenibacillus]